MIARHDGQVVLVAGAVPGERVAARVERAERRIAFAVVTRVLEASPDRRDGFSDAACGGCAYSHIAYPRQLTLKGDIVRDTFLRIGRIALEQPSLSRRLPSATTACARASTFTDRASASIAKGRTPCASHR